MKTKKKLLGAITSFAAASACLVGGTYAWFVISSTAQATVSGSVVSIDDVHIGIKSEEPLVGIAGTGLYPSAGDLLTNLHLEKDAVEDDIYWSTGKTATTTVRAGEFVANAIEAVAMHNGYSKVFTPVTTGAFEDDADIELKKGLAGTLPKAVGTTGYVEAKTGDYLKYTLVFKTPEPNSKIHLRSTNTKVTGLATVANEAGDSPADINASVESSIRVGFDNGTETSIFRPSLASSVVDPVTEVGGRMDLDGDDVWDYYELGGNKYEIFYGEFDGFVSTDFGTDLGGVAPTIYGLAYDTTAVSGEVAAASAAGTNTDFLDAGSLDGVFTFDDVDAIDALTQQNHVLADYIPGASTIALVETDADGIGELDVTVWIEGWDEKCINQISTELFSLVLGFVAINS